LHCQSYFSPRFSDGITFSKIFISVMREISVKLRKILGGLLPLESAKMLRDKRLPLVNSIYYDADKKRAENQVRRYNVNYNIHAFSSQTIIQVPSTLR